MYLSPVSDLSLLVAVLTNPSKRIFRAPEKLGVSGGKRVQTCWLQRKSLPHLCIYPTIYIALMMSAFILNIYISII